MDEADKLGIIVFSQVKQRPKDLQGNMGNKKVNYIEVLIPLQPAWQKIEKFNVEFFVSITIQFEKVASEIHF